MRFELRYFTGTGNSWKLMDTCKSVFTGNGHQVTMQEIKGGDLTVPETDIAGFCFPVYAFGIPRICRNYLRALKRFETRQRTFVLITAGDADESGFAVDECRRILRRKNCEIVYSGVIQMPINWITSSRPPFPPSQDEAKVIIEEGIALTISIAGEILNGIQKHHKFNYPERYPLLKFYWEYLAFKYMGVQNMWRTFKVYDTCNGCRVCGRICPTGSILFAGGKPVWSATCEQCMRCVNFCPEEAIYQSFGGDTRGRNRYFEPDFKPVRH
jgi:ferredoxin